MGNRKKLGSGVCLSALDIRRISLDALVSEPTLRRALDGRPVRSLSRERIRRALETRGLANLLAPEAH